MVFLSTVEGVAWTLRRFSVVLRTVIWGPRDRRTLLWSTKKLVRLLDTCVFASTAKKPTEQVAKDHRKCLLVLVNNTDVRG